jgi:hypothetical protein
MQSVQDLIQEALRKGYKSKWILNNSIDLGITVTLFDLYQIAKAFNHHRNWIKYTAEEFGIKKNDKPNIYFKGSYESNYHLKKALIEWQKKLHGNISESQKLKHQYFNYLSRKKKQ